MKSVMTHSFSKVPKATIPRSSFDRSHGHKTTFDADWLIPILVDECLPGDTYNVNLTAFARLATPIFPVMDNIFMDTFYFAVPMRLLWSNWEKFNGEQVDPDDSIDFTIPVIASPVAGYPNESIHDYFGIPTKIAVIFNHSAMWHRAYNLIWNEWFRDENLQDSVTINIDNGPDLETDYTLLKRGKRHDYFTSALPWPQKNNAGSISIPLGTSAPITTDALETTEELTIVGTVDSGANHQLATGGAKLFMSVDESGGAGGALYADLSNATAATINQLRQSFQIQKLVERDARGGTRYVEIIKSHFGVTSPDFRLQRPEFLGGGSQIINISTVPQTSSTDATTPQGNLAAFGTAALKSGFTKSFTEHCVIIGLVSVRADLTYQQGLARMFSRSTRYDFYWPSLAMIGEQTILNKEIWLDGSANDLLVFGYQERYAEYRYKPSQITGKFRANDAATLEAWHLSIDFATLPALDATFIQSDTPIDRVIAVPTEPHFIFDSYFQMTCARPMPIYGVPGLIDHF